MNIQVNWKLSGTSLAVWVVVWNIEANNGALLLAGTIWLNAPRAELLARLLALEAPIMCVVLVPLQASTITTTAVQHREIKRFCLKLCRGIAPSRDPWPK